MMTKGEVISALATIKTFDQICGEKWKKDVFITISDVNMMMPFVTKAQEAAERLSLFALDNYNSPNKETRELVKIIHNSFSLYSSFYLDFEGPNGSVDWLNNNIKSVNNQINNTYQYLSIVFKDEPENTDSQLEELEAENKRLSEKNKELETENTRLNKQLQQRPQSEEPTVPVDEWFTSEYEELSADEEFTLRERLVFFSTVLSLENNKKYTVASNLENFIKELCNDQKNIGPFFSKMKRPDEAAVNAKAARKVANLMKLIIPEDSRNNKHLKINQLIDSMLLNFPENEDD